jgi:hypothetical protein
MKLFSKQLPLKKTGIGREGGDLLFIPSPSVYFVLLAFMHYLDAFFILI